MPTVRASCRDCGEVELTVEDLTLSLCIDDDRNQYRFVCPACAMIEIKPVSENHITILTENGVKIDAWTMPAELFESRQGGVEISHDDLLDFHEQLQNDNLVMQSVMELTNDFPDIANKFAAISPIKSEARKSFEDMMRKMKKTLMKPDI